MTWTVKTFEQLSTFELYNILKARCEVFIVEQNCPYLDTDSLDFDSIHIFAVQGGEIAAYCRITPKGTRFSEVSIGRIITTAGFRGMGLGKELMRRAIDYIAETEEKSIRISAQAYLKGFYESFGFRVVSDEYLEDDIPHLEMLFQD